MLVQPVHSTNDTAISKPNERTLVRSMILISYYSVSTAGPLERWLRPVCV